MSAPVQIVTPNISTPGSLMLTHEQRETAQYVADMILELRNMSKALKLYTIAVPLEYAYYEAFSLANRVPAPPAEIARIRVLSRAAEEEY